MTILVLNGGSSSIKFSVFVTASEGAVAFASVFEGELSGVGTAAAKLKSSGGKASEDHDKSVAAQTIDQALVLVLDAIAEGIPSPPDAVGHRVVHPGAKLQGHQRVTPEVLDELESAADFAPLHDPEAVQLIHAAMKRYRDIPHVVCFDTVFHETMPVEAKTYPLPALYRERGVRRYGFHGLSCESIVRQLEANRSLPRRMIIAHLGSGCSVTALADGRSVDTTMGLTPTGGVIMGTRSGDLDPGLVLYLLRQQQGIESAVAAVETLLNRKSGLVALSDMANDVKALRLAAGQGSEPAKLALKVFTRSITKAIGGYSWLLGGLDAIVFTGGIGEHDSETRKEVLSGLESFDVILEANPVPALPGGIQQLSSRQSSTAVFIVPAQEDLIIALHVERLAGLGI